MNSVQEIILLFTKYPVAGSSKTRLIPALGPQGAAELQRQMGLSMSLKLQDFIEKNRCRLEIHYEGGGDHLMQRWLGAGLCFKKQQPGHLGHRMAKAIVPHLGRYRAMTLVGSDCPGINADILSQSFAALHTCDVVLGPAFDGGYYLLGVQGGMTRRQLHGLFRNIDWGTERVLEQTRARIRELQLRCHLLEKLHDIDRPEDLRYIDHHSDSQ